jgi:hypothetical protein
LSPRRMWRSYGWTRRNQRNSMGHVMAAYIAHRSGDRRGGRPGAGNIPVHTENVIRACMGHARGSATAPPRAWRQSIGRSIPSLSSSPWMRGTPHRGFSRLIRWTRLRNVARKAGRPSCRCDFRGQNRRKPVRCQRRTGSGLKMIDASIREGNSRQRQRKIRRCLALSLGRAGAVRFRTMSRCRRETISASRSAGERRNHLTKAAKNSEDGSFSRKLSRLLGPQVSG